MLPDRLETDRLRLRRWRPADHAPFAALNADPQVMEFFPATLSRAESDAMISRIEASFETDGFGLWAVERLESAHEAGHPFIGYVGLWRATFAAHFTPAIEIGWRLARAYWGRGFAPEAARAAMQDGFARLDVDELVSFTSRVNRRSQRVMQKLGMRRDPRDDFGHPAVEPGDRLHAHVLFRMPRGQFRG